jgi:hypothetical protein
MTTAVERIAELEAEVAALRAQVQARRMLKVQQKIAGSFRADHGAEAFARIRGYLSSMR